MFFARIKEGSCYATAAGWHFYIISSGFASGFRSFQRILCKGVASFDRTVMELNTKNRGGSCCRRCYCYYPYLRVVSQTLFHRHINLPSPPPVRSPHRLSLEKFQGYFFYRTSYNTRRSISLPVHAMLEVGFFPRSKHRQLQPKRLGEFCICSTYLLERPQKMPNSTRARSKFSVTATRPKRAIIHG